MSVLVYDELDLVQLDQELGPSDVALIVESAYVWVRTEDGTLEEVNAGSVADFTLVGWVFGRHSHDVDPIDATLGEIGHIGGFYFACYYSEWLWLGSAPSPEEGLDLLKDHMGVFDPSGMWMEDEPR